MLALVPESAGRTCRSRYAPDREGALESTVGWPLLADPVPAGDPAPADDHVECWLNLDAHLIRNPDASFLVRVRGDSLREAGLHDGDLLVVDRAVPPLAGSVVVVALDGKFALRRLARDAAGRLALEPADPHPSDAPANPVQDFEIWGVVRWTVHRLWPSRDQPPGGEPLSFRSVPPTSTTAR